MILDGLVLGAITGGGFYLIYKQLPLSVRLWLHNHMLLTRVTCAIGVYALLGGTLTAMFAAAWLDLLIGCIMALMKNEETATALDRMGAYLKDTYDKFIGVVVKVAKALPEKVEPTTTTQVAS